MMRLKKYIGPAILFLVGTYMLRLSWFKWPDLLIDYGRELYVPWQITQGKVLYADLNHLYGPLSHYLNALLFHVFGVGLSTLAYFNMCLVVILVFLIYDLFKATFGDFIATVVGVCFLVVFAFSQYVGISNYNFICPYSHEITYGIFLFFLLLFVFRKYLAKQESIFTAIMGFLVGLIFLTKVEIFIASFITILTGIIFTCWQLRPPEFRKHLFFMMVFFLFPIVAFFIYFSLHMPLVDAFGSIIASYKSIFMGALVNNIFYLRISGFDNPLENLSRMFGQVYGYLIVLIFTAVIAYLYSHMAKRIFRYGWIALTFVLVFALIFLGYLNIHWIDIARPYPIFLLLLIVYLIIELILKREDKAFLTKHLPFVLLSLFSLFLLLKMILNVHLYHYGFALAMPATLVMVTVLLYYVPKWFSPWGSKEVVTGFMGLFIFLSVLSYFNTTKHIYNLKNYAVSEGRDRFFTFSDRMSSRGPIVNITLKKIGKIMTKNDTFIVFPESVMLNYLSRRSNPVRFFEFTPNFVTAMGETNILNAISMSRPSFILLCEFDTSEHGARYFGKNYALNIHAWLVDSYERVLLTGAEPLTGGGFGIIIAKRKS